MKQYKQLLQDIIDRGVWKEARQGIRCLSLFAYPIEFNLQDGFPLLTMKKMFFKTIVKEWLWMFKGNTDASGLIENNVNVWNGDVYSKYKFQMQKWLTDDDMHNFMQWSDLDENDAIAIENIYSKEEFIDLLKKDRTVREFWGKRIAPYGHNFRNWGIDPRSHGTGIDQISNIIKAIKDNPYDRRHIISGWDPSTVYDFYLPQCHSLMIQFNCRPMNFMDRQHAYGNMNIEQKSALNMEALFDKEGVPKFYLDMFTYQRSCDTPLGVPFNIVQAGLMLSIFAQQTNMVPGKVTYVFGDVHIYENQLESVKEFLKREPKQLPLLALRKKDKIDHYDAEDFEILNYDPHPKFDFILTT